MKILFFECKMFIWGWVYKFYMYGGKWVFTIVAVAVRTSIKLLLKSLAADVIKFNALPSVLLCYSTQLFTFNVAK